MHPNLHYDPGPIVGIQIYKKDVVVRRRGQRHPNCVKLDTGRGKITMLSKKSRKRLAFIANNTDVTLQTMITLTYPREFPNDGKAVKRNLNTFLVWCRRVFDRPSYLWFLEFQKRGAPHIHILLDYPLSPDYAKRVTLYSAVSEQWYKIVGSGDEKHRRAGTRVERIRRRRGAARYVLKYAYKCQQKWVPAAYQNVGRFWGCSRDVPPKQPRTIPMDEPTVRGIIKDWDYCPDNETMVYQTLFGCAQRFEEYSGVRAYLAMNRDNGREPAPYPI